MLYFTLFTASLLAATLLPGGSEALLLYDLSLDTHIFSLWSLATLGNAAGAVINYFLGKKGSEYLLSKRHVRDKYLQKAHRLFARYGAVALLFSWMPVVGDPVTFVAGILRYSFGNFILVVLIAKGIRYGVVIGLYFQLF